MSDYSGLSESSRRTPEKQNIQLRLRPPQNTAENKKQETRKQVSIRTWVLSVS
uniref:Uncharacterized protein n=1 Tax=Meleagris gallopavo TaxID=9103 RepID=A0A803XUB6_MELGA